MGLGAISPLSLRRTLPFLLPCILQHSLHYHSLTAILVSRFLINLQEANLRSVKVDSDDPAYITSHSQNSLPSFVAALGTTRAAGESSVEHVGDGTLDLERDVGDVDNWEDNSRGVRTLPVEAEV